MKVKNNLFLMYQTHSNKVFEIKKSNFKRKIKSDALVKSKRNALGVIVIIIYPITI